MCRTYGICQYLFTNQYTIITIYHDVKNVTQQKMKKIVNRTTLVLIFIYFATMFVGYYSLPNYDENV